jgi:hypothetical protein
MKTFFYILGAIGCLAVIIMAAFLGFFALFTGGGINPFR